MPSLTSINRYWRILNEQKRPLRFLLSRLLMHSGLCRLFTIEQRGFRLRFQPTALSAALWIDPRDRESDQEFLESVLGPGDVVVDVGANIGNTALAAASRVGPGGRVLAFEPHPRTHAFLLENVALNDARQVEVVNAAVGDRPGTVKFSSLSADDINRVLASGEADSGLTVPVRTLDEALAGVARIDLLKIDVEGYEKRVLEGAGDVLARTACVFYESVEADCAREGYSTSDLVAMLQDRGFRVLRRVRDGGVIALERGYRSTSIENLIAVASLDRFLERTGWRLRS